MTVFKRIYDTAYRHPDVSAVINRDGAGETVHTTYAQLMDRVREVAAGLQAIGVTPGMHVGLISDNRPEWLYCDLAVLALGAVDVPMGADITEQEARILLDHAECSVCIVETGEIAERVLDCRSNASRLTSVIVMNAPGPSEDGGPSAFERAQERAGKVGVSLYSLQELGRLSSSRPGPAGGQEHPSVEACFDLDSNEPATIVYTSGTTGEPKGVILTHATFLFHMERAPRRIGLHAEHVVMSTLPVWQSTERAIEYAVLGSGATIAYSGPTLTRLSSDLQAYTPHYLTAVPRLWEGLERSYRNEIVSATRSAAKRAAGRYARVADRLLGRRPVWNTGSDLLRRLPLIPLWFLLLVPGYIGRLIAFGPLRKRFGPRFRSGLSGGGAMPRHTDRFFRAAGLTLLECYGVTEGGSLLAIRDYRRPVIGTVGKLYRDIESRIVDETGTELGVGERGVLHVRTSSAMTGYHRSPEMTAGVFNRGWLNTGDIVMQSRRRELCILGRAKDTIILLGGENIEPEPLEQRLTQSELIQDAMVVGQDKRYLGALIVVDEENVAELLREHQGEHLPADGSQRRNIDLNSPVLHNRIRRDITRAISANKGYRLHEQIYRFSLLAEPFKAPEEVTPTGKKRRAVIERRYRRQIEAMYR